MLSTLLASTPPPNPANTPLGHYLLHPGAETSVVRHHVLHLLEAIAAVLAPIAIGTGALLVLVAVVRLLARYRRPIALAKTIVISPGSEVDASGGAAFRNALHGVFRRGGRAAFLGGRPHVAFEVTRANGRLAFSIWVPPEVSAERIALAVEASWPGKVRKARAAGVPASHDAAERAHLAGRGSIPEHQRVRGQRALHGREQRLLLAQLRRGVCRKSARIALFYS